MIARSRSSGGARGECSSIIFDGVMVDLCVRYGYDMQCSLGYAIRGPQWLFERTRATSYHTSCRAHRVLALPAAQLRVFTLAFHALIVGERVCPSSRSPIPLIPYGSWIGLYLPTKSLHVCTAVMAVISVIWRSNVLPKSLNHISNGCIAFNRYAHGPTAFHITRYLQRHNGQYWA